MAYSSLVSEKDCGAGRVRTDGLLDAIQALSQLSYGPVKLYPKYVWISAKNLRAISR
tara:strand:- start:110 stop:280 length:171 start_codon:yes stop_codon:yes gene_type:complete